MQSRQAGTTDPGPRATAARGPVLLLGTLTSKLGDAILAGVGPRL
jgi:hypothetical protein